MHPLILERQMLTLDPKVMFLLLLCSLSSSFVSKQQARSSRTRRRGYYHSRLKPACKSRDSGVVISTSNLRVWVS